MRIRRLTGTALLAAVAAGATLAAPPGGGTAGAKQPAQQVRFDVQLTRTAAGGKEAQPGDGTPVVLASPVLTTLDRNTASVAVSGAANSYNVSLSPTVEGADNAVQVLWNLRIGGKDLPGGASSFTLTGATRVAPGKDSDLAEMTLTDPQTGRTATYRMRVRTSVPAPAATPAAAAAPNG